MGLSEDLVAQLREQASLVPGVGARGRELKNLLHKAAKEIERLQVETEGWQERLQWLINFLLENPRA